MKADIQLQPNISYQARAVMTCLENAVETHIISSDDTPISQCRTLGELDDLRIETFVMHNGRENGYCLTVQHGYSAPALLVFFASNRTQELGVFVWTEEVPHVPMNGPTISDFSDESYRTRLWTFGHKYEKAAEHICEQVAKFYEARAAEKAKKAS